MWEVAKGLGSIFSGLIFCDLHCGGAPTYKCLLENEQRKHREFGVATNVDLSVTKFTKQINANTERTSELKHNHLPSDLSSR